MLVNLIALFSILSAVALSSEVRRDGVDAKPVHFGALEEDNSHAEHILKILTKSPVSPYIEQARKLRDAAKLSKSDTVYIRHNGPMERGSFISRMRPNGDCSGEVIADSGLRMGHCTNDGDFSYNFACEQGDDRTVPMVVRLYWGAGCMPENEFMQQNVNEPGNKCSFIGDELATQGYQTVASQCTRDTMPAIKAGLLQTWHEDSECANAHMAYFNRNFDACQLYVDYRHSAHHGVVDSKTRFWYIKFAECTPHGNVVMHMYSDPACTRAKYKTTVNLYEGKPPYSCTYDEEVAAYTRFSCRNVAR